ncbi:hypothetical protein SAMN06265355_102418 [Actinomadura mexicana]|uniref:Uncharacterized protein n=1 Tax=Actinomadura mexicana TaxID=134959 RepID=A0A238VV67_9ACTN|nr:hypothetical protein SAMN06265355_102418 [Actinomadura mexicana]
MTAPAHALSTAYGRHRGVSWVRLTRRAGGDRPAEVIR